MSRTDELEHFRRVYKGEEVCNEPLHTHNHDDVIVMPQPTVGRFVLVIFETCLIGLSLAMLVGILLLSTQRSGLESLMWFFLYLVGTYAIASAIKDVARGK